MTDRNTKIRKILDLMKLAEGNSNEAERKSALDAANRLIKKYNIEAWELNPPKQSAGAVLSNAAIMWASMNVMGLNLMDLIHLAVSQAVSAEIIIEGEDNGNSTSEKK